MTAGKLEYVNPEYFTEGEVDDFLISENEEPEPEPELNIPTTDKYKYMITDNSRLNYLCGSKGLDEDMKLVTGESQPIVLNNSPIDYTITLGCKPDEPLPDEVDKRETLSYMNVKSIEEGEEWYKQNFPQVPEELYSIMARWNWGDLSEISKKDIKNDKKRVSRGKKPKKEPVSLQRKTGNFIVEF